MTRPPTSPPAADRASAAGGDTTPHHLDTGTLGGDAMVASPTTDRTCDACGQHAKRLRRRLCKRCQIAQQQKTAPTTPGAMTPTEQAGQLTRHAKAAARTGMSDQRWTTRAACAGIGDLMDVSGIPGHTPDTKPTNAEQTAIGICQACPVLLRCTTWVLALDQSDDPHGMVCAGLTHAARAAIRADRYRAVSA